MNKSVPVWGIIGAIVAVVALLGFLMYQGATGGIQGDGHDGRIGFPGGGGVADGKIDGVKQGPSVATEGMKKAMAEKNSAGVR